MPKKIKAETAVAARPGPKTGGLLPIYQFCDCSKVEGQAVKVFCPVCGQEVKTTCSRKEQSGIWYRWHFCRDACKYVFRTEQK
jgi:YHS domain-containing protein